MILKRMFLLVLCIVCLITFKQCKEGKCDGSSEECKCFSHGGPRKSYLCDIRIFTEKPGYPGNALVGQFLKMHGDTLFHECNPTCPPGVIMDTLLSISYTTNKIYDTKHPANTPLDDIVKIQYNTAKQYIQSGYKGKTYTSEGDSIPYLKQETLQEFNAHPKENYLIYRNFYISFTSPPDVGGDFIFTVTYKTRYGSYYDNKINIVTKDLPQVTLKGK